MFLDVSVFLLTFTREQNYCNGSGGLYRCPFGVQALFIELINPLFRLRTFSSWTEPEEGQAALSCDAYQWVARMAMGLSSLLCRFAKAWMLIARELRACPTPVFAAVNKNSCT